MKYFLIIFSLFLFACSGGGKSRDAGSDVLIPLFAECAELVKWIQGESKVPKNNYVFNMELELFDKQVISHGSVLGTVRLSLNDNWYDSDELSDKNPKEYLMIHAAGIQSDCSPDNYIKLDYKDIETLSGRIESMKKSYGNKIYISHESDGIVIYFNDGSYSYPH